MSPSRGACSTSRCCCERGTFDGLRRALESLSPEQLLDQVKEANVRGRGGAGFPAGMKWEFAARRRRPRQGDRRQRRRGRPGLLHRQAPDGAQPELLLEGMALAGYAVGASHGCVLVRSEYPRSTPILREAVERPRRRAWRLSTSRCVEGAGSYVVGEETALLASLQGFRGTVSARPPFPAERGYHGKPTVVHNVETLCNIPFIALHGAEAYKALQPGRDAGHQARLPERALRTAGHVRGPLRHACLRDLRRARRRARRRPLDQGGADRRPAGRHPAAAGSSTRPSTSTSWPAKGCMVGHGSDPRLRRAHRHARAGASPARVRRARELRQVLPLPDRPAASVRDGRPPRRPRPRQARGAAGDARAGLAVRARRRHAGADPLADRPLLRELGIAAGPQPTDDPSAPAEERREDDRGPA